MTIPQFLPSVARYPLLPKGYGGALTLPPRLIVIHTTDNTAPAGNEAHYAATRTDDRANWTSAHFYVDSSGPLASVPLTQCAWAAFSYANGHGWHIEMCGREAGQAGAPGPAELDQVAAVVAQLCHLADIPVLHVGPDQVGTARGITGHYDITTGLHVGDHTDPGPSFDWAGFLTRVRRAFGDTPTPPTPQPPESGLVVDGILGPLTTSTWQRRMGTPVDGVITQPPGRSDLVRAVQSYLNAHGADLAVDGVGIVQDGHTVYQTTRALQRYLGTPVDGVLSLPSSMCVSALQKRLNAGTF